MNTLLPSSSLYSQPSFLTGFARLADLSGRYDRYNRRRDPDAAALARDWQVLGADMQTVLRSYAAKGTAKKR